MKITKRILTLLLALIVTMAFMPVAVYADDPDVEGLEISKSLNADQNEITLEAYVTGKTTTHTTTQAIPSHIVMVLDVSGSMGDGLKQITTGKSTNMLDKTGKGLYAVKKNGNYYEVAYKNNKWQYKDGWGNWNNIGNNDNIYLTRLGALKQAANSFIDSVYDNAVQNNVDNKISIVTYASDEPNSWYGYNGTETKCGLTSVESSKGNLQGIINDLSAGGATRTDLGMEHAYKVLKADEVLGISKVAIMFTDGEPTSTSTFEKKVANNTITQAKMIKKDLGSTVWSVGLFDGTPTDDQNKFMRYTSSNYPDATSMDSSGAKQDDKYYLTASNPEALNDIFQSIARESTEGGATVTITETAVVQDVMSPYFDISSSDPNSIKVYTSNYNGKNSSGTDTWGNLEVLNNCTKQIIKDSITDESGETKEVDAVRVTGFNFSDNWCGVNETTNVAHGKKLVIKIPVEDNGTGYGKISSNTAKISAVYPGDPDSTEPLESFKCPELFIPYIAVKHSSDNTTDIIRVKDVNASTLDITQPRDNTVIRESKDQENCGKYEGVKGANIYGGAFSSDAYSTVATYKNGNPMCGTEIDLTKVKDETIYMKEVSNAFLQPKTVTLSKDASAVKASYLLTAADSNKYQKVGFDFGGNEKTGEFTDNLTVKMVNGKVNTFTVGNLFNLSGNLAVVKIPYTDAGAATEIEDGKVYTANPFWVTLDGVKVTGIKSRTLTYKTGSLDKLAGEEYKTGDNTKGDNPAITDASVDSTTQKYRNSVNGFKTMALYSTAAIVPNEDGSGELELGEVLVPSETYTFSVKDAAVEEQPVVEEEQPKAEEPAKEPVKKQVTVGKVKIKSVTGAKKSFTVNWNKVKSVKGYKVAYKKNGSSKWTYKYVSSSKTSYKTSSKLKKGTYKVKVQAYKKVDGKKIYGKYSSTKSVKVK